jgi:UDP-MurNAc hydroxylase
MPPVGRVATIRYLGHAGFVVEHAGVRLLIDPWFHPAFLGSWFPFPDNRALLPTVTGRRFDALFVSHAHEDHFDERVLRALDPSTPVLVPRYRSRGLSRRLDRLGFTDLVVLDHQEHHQLAPGFAVTMLLDTSHKEDAGLAVRLDRFCFVDLNDCNTALSELPTGVDLLAAQFSGAMWYPNTYDYPPEVMEKKVSAVREDLMDTLVRKVDVTGARAYLPSAGPACFLDPALARYNDRDATIFPRWEQVADGFREACPDVEVVGLAPGDELWVETASGAMARMPRPDPDPGGPAPGPPAGDEDLEAYRERRRDEWSAFTDRAVEPVGRDELHDYFTSLQRRNRRLLEGFAKSVKLVSGDAAWHVRLGAAAGPGDPVVVPLAAGVATDYTLTVPPWVLRAVVDGETGWEEALLSLRVDLQRDPDVFDLTFMSLLRYGHQPAQTAHMVREREAGETIERDGLRMPRFCPHAGEDLAYATIGDGVIECPRHHWKWAIPEGTCIEGGSVDLRLELIGDTGRRGSPPCPPSPPSPTEESQR